MAISEQVHRLLMAHLERHPYKVGACLHVMNLYPKKFRFKFQLEIEVQSFITEIFDSVCRDYERQRKTFIGLLSVMSGRPACKLGHGAAVAFYESFSHKN